jgi:general secretion pathway protein K
VSRQRGSILVTVLFLAGLIAALAAIAAEVQRVARASSRSYAEGLRAEVAMRAAIERTVAQARDGLQKFEGAGTVRIAEAEVSLTIRDEISRVDLNHAPPELLAGIFKVVGIESGLAANFAQRIVERRGKQNENPDQRPGNAAAPNRTATPSAANPNRGTRTGPFLHVAELALVPGIPREAAAAVAPYVTVASGRATINAMLADPAVLKALPGVDDKRLRDFLDGRAQRLPFKDLISRLGSVQKFATEENGAAVRFDARVRMHPRIEKHFEVVVAVVPGDSEPYRILAWDANPPQPARALP